MKKKLFIDSDIVKKKSCPAHNILGRVASTTAIRPANFQMLFHEKRQ
ncbi:hypothetical protein [Leadbettera azotonutricia]|nr:hypothetical protein [Leadbettera azotonutricia]